jgi:hypothetical protein
MPFRVHNKQTNAVYTVGVVSDDETDITSESAPALTSDGMSFRPPAFAPSIDDITYVYDPQAASNAAGNKHADLLVEGAFGYLVDFRGINATGFAVTAAQKYVAYPVILGAQRPVPIDPTAEGGKFEFIQKPYIQSPGPTKGTVAA